MMSALCVLDAALAFYLAVSAVFAASLSGLQEQEINLKLRILVPQTGRQVGKMRPLYLPQMTVPRPASVRVPTAQAPGYVVPAHMVHTVPPSVTSVSHTSLPLFAPPSGGSQSPSAVPVVSSLTSGHPVSSSVSSVSHTSLPLQYYSVPARPILPYRQAPVRTLYPPAYVPQTLPWSPQVYVNQWNPWSRPLAPVLQTTTHAGKYGIKYNYSGPALPNKHINLTMGLGKICHCNKTTEEVKDEDVEEDDDVEEVPLTTSSPVTDYWTGYVPEELLEHAKKTLINGKVKVHKNVDKVRVKHKWKSSNYPKPNVPGVGDHAWNAFKEDVQKLVNEGNAVTNEPDDFSNDHDPDFEEPKGDNFQDGRHADDYEVREDDDGRPHFVDFWGNPVPKYDTDFKATSETIQDTAADYNKDPHGWNPEYTKGLWGADDTHLQVFSGHQQLPPGEKPTYDNGMGEGVEKNYDRYVADNGTWVGPKPDPSDDDLWELLKDAVSHEPALENPHESRKNYADVIRYLNSKKYPIAPSPHVPTDAKPKPMNQRLMSPRRQVQESKKSSQDGNLVDVNQLLEAVIFHKQQQARKEAATSAARAKANEDAEEEEEYEDEEDEEKPPPDKQVNNGHSSGPPAQPGSVCKGIRDVGLAEQKDGTQMAHVQGVVCVNSYDYSANEGQAEKTA